MNTSSTAIGNASPRSALGLGSFFRRRHRTDGGQLHLLRQSQLRADGMSDQALKDHADFLRSQTLEDRQTATAKIEFGGLVASAVRRTLGFQLHDVQLRAILAGFNGAIVEMQTGEGKTVVTGSTAALLSLTSPTVHVATTNAYLASRDLEEMAPVFDCLGIRNGLLPEENSLAQSQQAYQCQITYGPGYQFGFDYLRDQLFLREHRQSRLGVQTLNAIRGTDINQLLRQGSQHHTAIVDEADSVMIDEAVTPLVISGDQRVEEDPVPFQLAQKIAEDLMLDTDFFIQSPNQRIIVNDDSNLNCHQRIEDVNHLALQRPWRTYISNALRALHVLRRDVDYVVRDGEVQIVDQNTGRIFADRTWQDGLHQAVEAKERVAVKSSPPSVAQISRQRYLQMYDRLAGLTGTAASVVHEFRDIYRLPIVTIPTHLPSQRKNLPTRFFLNFESKLTHVCREVIQRHHTGQPVLIGTRTIAESLQVADRLKVTGMNPVVLNGVQDEDEADVVKVAGHLGAVTIATNMAGRGTDIKPDKRSIALGGLHVIGFSPNLSARIDRQLIGRSARQGQPGSSQFFIAATDEVIENYAPALAQQIVKHCDANGESTEDFQSAIDRLQAAIEAKQYENRKSLMKRDLWMDRVRSSIERE